LANIGDDEKGAFARYEAMVQPYGARGQCNVEEPCTEAAYERRRCSMQVHKAKVGCETGNGKKEFEA